MWAKVDDGFWCHPKVMGVPLAARGLWVSALSWSCAQRSPVVPAHFLAMVGATADDAALLVASGLWIEVDGGWEIHQWSEYQELSVSEKRAEAGKRGGRRSGEARRSKPKQTDMPTSANAHNEAKQTEASDEAGTHPIPTQPDPATSNSGQPQVLAPEPTLDVEQETNRAIGIYARRTAEVAKAENLPGYAAAVGRAVTAEQRASVRALIESGQTAEQAAATLTAPVASAPDPDEVLAARERARRAEEATRERTAEFVGGPVGDGRAGAAAARASLRPVPEAS